MKKTISILLLAAMLLSMLASCGFTLPQMAALDPDAYPGEANVQNTDYTTQTAWNGTDSDTSWYTSNPSASVFYLSDGADLKGMIDLIYASVDPVRFEGKTIQLKKDINLGGKAWSIPNSNGCFKGTFNGNNCTIGGFKMTVTTGNQSLLGAIGGSATVKNLTVTEGTITLKATEADTTGGVAGVISKVICESGNSVTVTNVNADCTIKQTNDTKEISYVGGVIGRIEGAGTAVSISNCSFAGSVSTLNSRVGGIVGGVYQGTTPITFTSCTNNGTVYAKEQIGGILGCANNVGADITFEDCTNNGTVSLKKDSKGGRAAGIVGHFAGASGVSVKFTNCNNTGRIAHEGEEDQGGNHIGGIAGYVFGNTSGVFLNKVTFSNCHNTGSIRANRTSGGLIGYVQRATELLVSNCTVNADMTFAYYETGYNRYVGGLVGAIDMSNVNSTTKIENCSVSGTMHIHEPFDYATYTGGLVGLLRKTKLQATNCNINLEMSTEHVEGNDVINLTVGTFEQDASIVPTNITYYYYNDIPTVENYAKLSNTAAYFKVLGYQMRHNTDDTYDFRYVFGVNNLQENDKGIGFQVVAKLLGNQVEAKNVTVYCPTVYSSIQAGGEPYSAESAKCQYICTLVIAGIPADEVVVVDGKHYSKNAILDITPITAYKDANEDVIVTEASIGAARHAYEHERYTFKQEAFTPYLPTAFETATAVTSAQSNSGSDRYENSTSFTVNIPTDGYYDFCFQVGLEGDADSSQTRYALVQFNSVSKDEDYYEQTELYYNVVVKNDIMRNGEGTTYLKGFGKELTAGTYTITFRQPYDELNGTDKSSSFDVRGVYYYKDAKDPVDANIPLPEGAVLYDGNFANNVTYALDGTDKTTFDEYVATLKSNGFTEKDDRTTTFQYSDFDETNTPADGNYTYTGNYVDGRKYYNYYYILTNADYMVNVYFCSATGDMRVVVSDAEEYEKYDKVNDENPTYTTVTTPLFAMLDIGGPNFTATSGSYISGVTNGLCFVYRLSDGRFIIVDGGYWNDKDTNGDEMARLFNWLQLHADYDEDGYYLNNKVTIAAWLITHHHSDHINGAYKFGMMYKDNPLVEIQNFLYNFPSYEYAKSFYGTDLDYKGNYTVYYPKMYTMLGHYDSQIVHSGMVYNFADASIEILATHEDFYPNLLSIYNNSSTIFKITLAGETFLVAGDLQEEGQIKAIKRCGTLLESDYLQVTHHGCNGQLEFYKYIVGGTDANPNTDTVILWPLPKGEDEKWYDGTSARDVANRWLQSIFDTNENDTTHFAVENWDTETIVIPNFTESDFSNTKPDELKSGTVITVAGSNCELGCTSTTSNHLYTNACPAIGEGSANSVVKLKNNNLYHYYIDTTLGDYTDAGVAKPNKYNSYIQFSFEVTTPGTYEIYSYMRVKEDSRSGIILIDNNVSMKMGYTITNLASIVDTKEGSYMYWDSVQVKLDAGMHTLTYLQDPNAGNTSWHFRTLYFVRVGD